MVGASGHRHRDARAGRGGARRGGGRRPVAWRRIGRAEHALALWLACSAGTASAADSGAGQGAAAAPLKVGAGARGGHAHAPGRADGLLLPVHPRLEHARHQRGLLGWLQRVGVRRMWQGVGCGRAKSGERPHSADLGGAAPMMPSEAEPMPVRANNWARDTPFPAGTRAESAAFCPLLFSAATRRSASKKVFPRIHLWETARWWDSLAPTLVHLEGFTAGSGQPGLNRGRGRPGSPLQAAGRPRT